MKLLIALLGTLLLHGSAHGQDGIPVPPAGHHTEAPADSIIAPDGTRVAHRPAGSIRGLVKDSRLGELINAQVIVMQGDRQAGRALTDYDGRYTIADLLPGEYTVVVTYQDQSETTREVHVMNKPVTVNTNFGGHSYPGSPVLITVCRLICIRPFRVPLLDLKQGAGTTSRLSQQIEALPY